MANPNQTNRDACREEGNANHKSSRYLVNKKYIIAPFPGIIFFSICNLLGMFFMN